MSTSDMVDDLEHLRIYLGLQSLNLLGHSGGGGIILGYAERYPEHASKLVLIDSDVTDIYPSPASKTFEDSRRNDPRYAQAIAHLNDPTPTDDAFQKNLSETLAWFFNDPEKYVPALKNPRDSAWVNAQCSPQSTATFEDLSDSRTALLGSRTSPIFLRRIGTHYLASARTGKDERLENRYDRLRA
jgi:pimeloyl-ACP methyl ester carboxylesterase